MQEEILAMSFVRERVRGGFELGRSGQGKKGLVQVGLGVAVEVSLSLANLEQRAKMERVMTSLAHREALGPPGLIPFGAPVWQNSSSVT